MLKEGTKGERTITVTEDKTAGAVGSGELKVYGTPSMIALIEETAWMSVAEYLEEGECTVGTKLDVEHLAATPVGMKVCCKTELTEIDGRRLVFSVDVEDEKGQVGRGIHERFIVNGEKFQKKADEKIVQK